MKNQNMNLKTGLQTIRPSFLVLTPVCVFLGLTTSLTIESPINLPLFFIILMGAVSAHISVNTLNEYHDFKSGLDLKTIKTPFSGGSGALPDNPEMASSILMIGLASLYVAIIIGFYLLLGHSMQILPIGLVGVALIITYTQWLNRVPFLCLIAPGLGFGILMVVGTHVVLNGEYSQLTWLISLVPFFLINNLLLLNQYPDIKADASVGRNTFPIAFGIKISNLVYAIFMLAAYSLILLYIVKGYIPMLSIIALLPLVFSLYALIGAVKYTSKIGDYPQYMGANVAASILTPLLLGISIVVG
jgi:1,4-dihydroxy-2-naphthoate octaprenyltransferase